MTRLSRRVLLALVTMLGLSAPCMSSGTSTESAVPPDARRGTEQTLLTFPEWYLVHSPAEYARVVKAWPAHAFPFMEQTGQLWSSYKTVTEEQVRGHYPMNPGYHVMIMVIATSTTVEYVLRSMYENTIGRASWLLVGQRLTDEDRYGANAAQEYVDFIRQEPWYLFDFTSRLKHLWTDVPLTGPGLVRKWERRYALTTEYAIKAAYGRLIEKATRAAYTPALMTTEVVVDHIPEGWNPPSGISVLKRLPDGHALLSLPRYFDFRIAATSLAQQNIHIADIAGNSSVILVTAWMKNSERLPAGGWRVLFEQPITVPPQTKRVALLMPVAELSTFLTKAPALGLTMEHVYDY